MFQIRSVNTVLSSIVVVLALGGCGGDTSIVQDAIMPNFSNTVKVGDAMEKWSKLQGCSSTSWDSKKDDNGKDIVTFTCTVDKTPLIKIDQKLFDSISRDDALSAYEKQAKECSVLIEKANEMAMVATGAGWGGKNNSKESAEWDVLDKKSDAACKKAKEIYNVLIAKTLKSVELSQGFIIGGEDHKSVMPTGGDIKYTFDDDKHLYSTTDLVGSAFNDNKIEFTFETEEYNRRQ